ncbi:MAG: tetratricopeptide repeat protein [Nitrospirae bacterium]|nr:tetratricopeptide repeat protein [Nitrospirota bacterium]
MPALALIFLLLITYLAYRSIFNNGFVSYDDYLCIVDNPIVKDGFTKEAVTAALISQHAANWHPLSWFSHMLDVELFGFSAGGHHGVSLLFHIANVYFLYVLLVQLTARKWESLIVTALFAVHPLNVEAVAWATQRKTVLSTLFWLLCLISYVRYTRDSKRENLLLALLFEILALLSKPQAVIIPLTMLILDFWPLERFKTRGWLKIFLEKIPFLGFSILGGLSAIWSQGSYGAVVSTQIIPFSVRIPNAIDSVFFYIGKVLYPVNLSCFYPYMGDSKAAIATVEGIVILITTLITIQLKDRLPYLLMGLLWFISTLLPVIGIIHVGYAAAADRYMYVPIVGIFILLVRGISEAGKRLSTFNIFSKYALLPVILALFVMTQLQVGFWKDSVSLYTHAANAVKFNYVAYSNLGQIYLKEGHLEPALMNFTEAYKIMPESPEINYNMFITLKRLGRYTEAEKYYVSSAPVWYSGDLRVFYKQFGRLMLKNRKYKEAFNCFLKTLQIDRNDVEGFKLIATALENMGRYDDAIAALKKAAMLNPDDKEINVRLEALDQKKGK